MKRLLPHFPLFPYTTLFRSPLPCTEPLSDPSSPRGTRTRRRLPRSAAARALLEEADAWFEDRKSTRLNSSHPSNSYAVFCLKKKKECSNDFMKFLVDIYNYY